MKKKATLIILPLIIISLVTFPLFGQEVKRITSRKVKGTSFKKATWLKIRVYEKGEEGAQVIVNIPIKVVNALMAHREEFLKIAKEKGGCSDEDVLAILTMASTWDEIQKLSPTELVEVVDKKEGTRVRIWLE
ncbi:MAG: hypothetical protein J7L64_03545 [Acidobacteria bacterium]|nr:hypothetical protein [Acidobacteriota bacterium]